MRQLLFTVSILFSLQLHASTKQTKCTILGTITDSKDGILYIRKITTPVPDTLKIENGSFKYTTELESPTPYVISNAQNKYQLFFCEPNAKINITLTTKDLQVTFLEGSKSHEIFRKLITTQEPVQKAAAQVQQALSQPGSNQDSLGAIMQQINSNLRGNFFNFIKENGSSEVAAFAVYSAISNDRAIQSHIADSMTSFLTGNARTSFFGNESIKIASKLSAVEVGNQAPDFTLTDSTGKKKYTLSKLRGTYLLVDFWASWCGPCKGEIPFMKTAYAKYHSQGFEIMSVSLDSKRDAWVDALKKFEMPWIHVSDVKGFQSIVNELYHIPSIPKTLLLDKTGKIIATDLRGEALDKKLEELLGNNK